MQRELNLASMEQSAIKALAALEETLDRIRFQQRLPHVRGRYDARMAYRTRRHPLTDKGLFESFEHALNLLNWSWNERHISDKEIKTGSPIESMISRPRFCVVNVKLIESETHRVIPVASPMYARYVCKWQNKRLRPIENDSLARLAARALSMHPLFSLSPALQARFSSVFYPDFTVRKDYCRKKLEGWQDLRWTVGEALRTSAYYRELQEYRVVPELVFEAKDAYELCLRLSLVGQTFAMKHIRMIVLCYKFDLLEDVFLRIPKVWKLISPRELLLWVCADGRFGDKEAVRMVEVVEKIQPGIVKRTTDAFGDTPLWYTLYRYQYGGHVGMRGWCERAPKLERLLRRLGCDPHSVNRLGLSWWSVHGELLKLR